MNSIGADCINLKLQYENCFNKWFSDKYLKGEYKDDCAQIFKSYQECVMKALKEKNLDIGLLEKDILGTEHEKPPPNK